MYVIVFNVTGSYLRSINPKTKATAWTSLIFLARKYQSRDEAYIVLGQFDDLTRSQSRIEKL